MNEIAKLQFLDTVQRFHHASLWEEEKHFSWLSSLILSGQVLLFTTDRLISSRKGLVLMVAASLLGWLISAMALRSIRKEGEYFTKAFKDYAREYNSIFPDTALQVPDPKDANKSYSRLLQNFFRLCLGRNAQFGVRDAFQVVFLGFDVAFFVMPLVLLAGGYNSHLEHVPTLRWMW